MIFVDTGAWYASIVVDEPHHHDVAAWIALNAEPLLTTDFCLAETLNLLVARRLPMLASSFAKSLFERTLCDLHFVTEEELARAIPVFQIKCYAGWSFTDCISKTVIDALEIRTAIALDDHFRQFGIKVVP